MIAALLLGLLVQVDREGQRVEQLVSPAVVRIRNAEAGGTGILIDPSGLVITNAHVACSPMPHVVDVELRDGWKVYRRVMLLGVHRERDLALVKIDPLEHGSRLPWLKIRSSELSQGERVYAVGFPGDIAGGTLRTTTIGTLKGWTTVYGQPHLDTDATVWFGNSGGPLCDGRGDVIGVVTLKGPKDNRAAAVPLRGFARDDFVEIRHRPRNAVAAAEYMTQAEKMIEGARRGGGESYEELARVYLVLAATMDAGNAALHARIGLLDMEMKRPTSGAAYLARSLQISAWPDRGVLVYLELAEALLSAKRPEEALAVSMEGALKYPREAGPCLRVAAMAEALRSRWPEAVRAATLAIERGTQGNEDAQAVLTYARERMRPAERETASQLEAGRNDWIDGLARATADGRAQKRQALDVAFDRFLRTFDGVQAVLAGKEAAPAPAAEAPAPAARPAPEPLDATKFTDEEVTALFLKAQLKAARSQIQGGRKDAAAEILRSIVKENPARPEAREAKELLDGMGRR
jgi:tetratricopeptide (TPR) repeat protein